MQVSRRPGVPENSDPADVGLGLTGGWAWVGAHVFLATPQVTSLGIPSGPLPSAEGSAQVSPQLSSLRPQLLFTSSHISLPPQA